jgi:hypothetical protein
MKTLLALLLAALPVASLGQSVGSFWAIQHQPAAATAATIAKAASTNGRHVATSITICVSAVAAQPTLVFNLRDGATGAGTIVWSTRLMATIGQGMCHTAQVNIIGTKNTAMTLESAAAPAATNFATVSLNGWTTY